MSQKPNVYDVCPAPEITATECKKQKYRKSIALEIVYHNMASMMYFFSESVTFKISYMLQATVGLPKY